ncbi:DUF4244 domain-containing protein [Actinokineospora iranica]|uniref:DUF4244 domain-containing protein n=1 Tax=Actinokineospora iranica TaxID=1271860 RepID=A0A1G6XVC7_9PSEU|nr:DUF4244 domain-containing protein [Actinokineospora iranica]SDD82080.1 Protein of unknown function [Actinokineospora iranica]
MFIRSKIHDLVDRDDGMSTVEYALCTIAAAAFAALLFAIVSSPAVFNGLTALIERALTADW